MSVRGRLALGIIVVFLAGVATGLFVGAWHAHRAFMEVRSGHVGHRMREHLQRSLKLTPEQDAKVAPILDKVEGQLETIRSETGRRVSGVMSQSHRDIAPYLTPEQRAQLDEMAKRHHRMMLGHEEPPPPPPAP